MRAFKFFTLSVLITSTYKQCIKDGVSITEMRAKYAMGAVLCSGDWVCTHSIQVLTILFWPLILSYGHTQPMKMKVVPVLLTGMKTKVINHKYRENKLWRQIVADTWSSNCVSSLVCFVQRARHGPSSPRLDHCYSVGCGCKLHYQHVNIGMTSFSGQSVSYHCSVYSDKKPI